MGGESDHGFRFSTLLQQARNIDVTHPERFAAGNHERSQNEGTVNPPLSYASETKRRKQRILTCFLTKGNDVHCYSPLSHANCQDEYTRITGGTFTS